jgi:NADP-dependent 3-hydroxy acid dehydrogenase YdfG
MTISAYRSVLLTGASGLMGQALVEAFSKAGMEVHALSRNKTILEELSARTGCIAHAADVADTAALEKLVPALNVDVLVNNAGVAASGSIHDCDPASIDQQVDVNLRAVMHLARLVLPGMMERDRGHIVTISSMSGHYNFPGNAAYHATKAAIQTLCRQLRIDLSLS